MGSLENLPTEYIILAIGALALASFIFNITLYLKVNKLKQSIKDMLGGESAKTIEDSLKKTAEKLKEKERKEEEIKNRLISLEKRMKKSIRGVETVRFNPFKGIGGGGNQSFSTSFVDEEGDGVVISTLYSRERVGVYGKPVSGFSSEHTLSEEEERSLNKARERIKGE
ncbi:MAG: DUF4446 family protein [Patescibacteria group bacterium]